MKQSNGKVVHNVADYERVMEQFRKLYNEGDADGIGQLFEDPERIKSFMSKKSVERLMNDYGKIISCKYMGMEPDNDVALFKMVCEKSIHAMGISIYEDNKLGTFRFETSSPYIDKLLAKEL